MSKTYLNPPGLFPSQQYGFSQVVATTGNTTVYLSGQVAWNAEQQIGDRLDLGAQTRRALENIETAVRAAGGTRSDVVSLRLYIVGEHIHNGRPVREALCAFFPPDKLPSSTWIGVPAESAKQPGASLIIEFPATATSRTPPWLLSGWGCQESYLWQTYPA